MYDVLIIGAGPIGCYLGYLLAKKGAKVAIVEEHSAVGEHINCSGIVSTETFEKFGLPLDSILSKMNSIKFISPSGKVFTYHSGKYLAYIADRPVFDRNIARMAENEGVKFIFNSRINDALYNNGSMIFSSNNSPDNNIFTAKVGVIATGYGSGLPRKIGCGAPPRTLFAAQADVKIDGLEETEIYLGNEIAPGSFAWATPLGNSNAKIGLSVAKEPITYLKKLLYNPYFCDRVKDKTFDIKCSAIPVGIIPKSHTHNAIVLGEAAGQLKSTTHGGIFYGLVCSEIAAESVLKALGDMDNCSGHLKKYEDTWRGVLEAEINLGIYLRQIFSKFRDDQIDFFVELAGKEEMESVAKKFEFDWHKATIRGLLKSFKQFLY